MVPEYSSPAIFYLRLILAVLSIVAFLFGVLTALLSIAKFRGESCTSLLKIIFFLEIAQKAINQGVFVKKQFKN